MSLTIQQIFNDCISLDKQRHFAQRILVPFSFDLRNEDQTRYPPAIDVTIVKASGHLSYSGQRTLRPRSPDGGLSVGPAVVIPGNLFGSVPASANLEIQGIGGGDFIYDIGTTISAPVGGSNATIDISSRNPALLPFYAEFEADPNTALPLKVIGFVPAHNKNTLVLALGPPALV